MTDCPLCLPRPDDCPHWLKIATLGISSLYLDRNQTYRGHCQLVFDGGHVVGLENLPPGDFTRLMGDVHRAAGAIVRACRPDLMNYASLGNVVPHIHWHLVPRYHSDPRWGKPIYFTDLADMPITRLAADEFASLAETIRSHLERRTT